MELHEKMDLLWSFLKFHQKSKILAFFQSCKQVSYVVIYFITIVASINDNSFLYAYPLYLLKLSCIVIKQMSMALS